MKSLKKILSEKDLELHRNNPNAHPELLLRFIWKKENRNPTPDDIPPYKNSLWLNLKNGEIFVHLKTCNGKAFWKGQFGTLIVPSTVNVFDIFGDGSAVALYRFDGNANDDGGRYNGTWYGNEQYDVGKFGQAAKFDEDSYILINPYPNLTVPFTISLWIYTDNDKDNYDSVFHFVNTNGGDGSEDVFEFWSHDDKGNVFVSINGTDITIHPFSEIKGKWTHYAFVVNDKTYVYRNRALIKTIDSIPDMSKVDRLQFGADWDPDNPGTNHYKGLLDQLRIFNRALTKDEVQVLYNEKEVC